MSEHARLSASGSKKWLNCPLSLSLEEQIEDKESVYAKEGTIAHALGELKLKFNFKQLGRAEYSIEREKLLTELSQEEIKELENYTDDYVSFITETYNKYSLNCSETKLLIEERLDYSRYAKEGFGTGDIVITDYETVEIIDLKYGKGVKVDAFENPQLMLYGLGALEIYNEFFDIKTIKMTIFQPRLDNISSFEMSPKALIKWGEEVVKPKSEQAYNGVGACVYGTHCDEGFCKARPLCRVYNEHHTAIKKYENKHPSLLTKEELVDIYDVSTSYDKWIKSVKTYLLQDMLKGEKYPGLKLVEGRSIRSFLNEKDVVKALKTIGLKKTDYVVEKLISVTDAEKMLGKTQFDKFLGKLVVKPKGAPTIAKAEDKRLEYNSAELDFQDIQL